MDLKKRFSKKRLGPQTPDSNCAGETVLIGLPVIRQHILDENWFHQPSGNSRSRDAVQRNRSDRYL